jgi:hypothetical protein
MCRVPVLSVYVMEEMQLFYFADGKKVALKPVKDLIAQSDSADDPLPKSVTLTPREPVKEADSETTGVKNALPQYPVYTSGESGYMVALPEVRVQEQCVEPSPKFAAWLAKNEDRIEVVGQKRGQTIIRPLSGKGEDAIQIANEIYEEIEPAMSQPRFLRVVDRPQIHG